MKIIMITMIVLSFNFMFMKHPLSMGSILLIQTLLSCLSCSWYLNTHLLSYILFLIFIGGMLILFMYMSSIASNEKFFFSMKLLTINMVMFITLLTFMNEINLKIDIFNKLIYMFNSYDNFMMNKLYMFPSGNITLLMVIYLLFTLIVVVNIVSSKIAPLRSN